MSTAPARLRKKCGVQGKGEPLCADCEREFVEQRREFCERIRTVAEAEARCEAETKRRERKEQLIALGLFVVP